MNFKTINVFQIYSRRFLMHFKCISVVVRPGAYLNSRDRGKDRDIEKMNFNSRDSRDRAKFSQNLSQKFVSTFSPCLCLCLQFQFIIQSLGQRQVLRQTLRQIVVGDSMHFLQKLEKGPMSTPTLYSPFKFLWEE